MSARIEAALAHIPADHRETWVMCAMGVKSELGDAGFDLWNEWSQQATSYSASAARSVWKSCRGGAVSIGSVFHEARAHGWRDDDKHEKPSREMLEARQRENAARLTTDGLAREQAQQQAAKKAGWILHQCKPERHAYFDMHGMREQEGLVWWPDENQNLLCIPMRVGHALVGVQLIDRTGGKKFLTGQRTSGAEYLIDHSGHGAVDYWVEGYCTGLALRACLSALKMRYRIHITFSAHNMKSMANSGYVIADNDASGAGEKAAQATGLPYWMSDIQGEDFSDMHQRLGTFRASQALKKWLAISRA